MSTIYTNNADRRAFLDVPVTPTSDSIAVSILGADGTVLYSTTDLVDEGDGTYSITVPFNLTQTDRELEIHWEFDYVENGEHYAFDDYTYLNVVTPILPLREIKTILGPDSTDEEISRVERAVRYIIQAHTGQFFGKFIGEKSVTGNGQDSLRLPMRLLTLSKINGSTYWVNEVALRGSGWFLKAKSLSVPTIKADFDGWHEEPWGYSGKAPIVAPYSKVLFGFLENAEYVIDGVWGWNTVPEPVREAARLLVNDYACNDAQYRDRFLESVTAADWRLQFNDGAFTNTGNVRANQLLAEYVLRRGWAVL